MKLPFRQYYPMVVWPMIVLALHGLAIALSLYEVLPWFDTVFHFLGGVSIALGTTYIIKYLEHGNELKTIPAVKIVLILSMTTLAAVLWEFFEYDLTFLFGIVTQPSVYDVMKDLAMGLLGAVVVSIFYRR